jgi:imidazolonepropionase
VPTFLAAHAATGVRVRSRGYLRLLTDEMLPGSRGASSGFCDVFCEEGVFSVAESDASSSAHANWASGKSPRREFTPLGEAELAVRVGRRLPTTCCGDGRRDCGLAASDTIATLLPGTAFFLGMPFAPARTLIDRGAPLPSPPTATQEPVRPKTSPSSRHGLYADAHAAGRGCRRDDAQRGGGWDAPTASVQSEPGKQADLIVCHVPDYRHLFYHFGVNHVCHVIGAGEWPAGLSQPLARICPPAG